MWDEDYPTRCSVEILQIRVAILEGRHSHAEACAACGCGVKVGKLREYGLTIFKRFVTSMRIDDTRIQTYVLSQLPLLSAQ